MISSYCNPGHTRLGTLHLQKIPWLSTARMFETPMGYRIILYGKGVPGMLGRPESASMWVRKTDAPPGLMLLKMAMSRGRGVRLRYRSQLMVAAWRKAQDDGLVSKAEAKAVSYAMRERYGKGWMLKDEAIIREVNHILGVLTRPECAISHGRG